MPNTAKTDQKVMKGTPAKAAAGNRSAATAEKIAAVPIGELPLLEWEKKLRKQLDTGGLWIRDTRGPTFDELRPFGPRETPGFPVYSDLETRLLQVQQHPDPVIAHVLATCSGYAYSGADTVSMIMARMGLEANHCRMIASSVDGMLIHSTSFIIQSQSGKVAILCYRGVEPTSFMNWMTAADVQAERMAYHFGDPCATVHAGFYRNVRATRYQVMGALKRACEGRSVRLPLPDDVDGTDLPKMEKLKALYITGHSLGGAMAAMMAVMLRHERKYRDDADRISELLRAVYTFGQPMIGDDHFAKACEEEPFLRDKVIRYVYDSDVVPHLPPISTGPFRHFGREYQYRIPHLRHSVVGISKYLGNPYNPREGDLREQQRPARQALTFMGGFGLALLALAGSRIQALRSLPVIYSLEDHFPRHYIAAVTPYGVTNEFGD